MRISAGVAQTTNANCHNLSNRSGMKLRDKSRNRILVLQYGSLPRGSEACFCFFPACPLYPLRYTFSLPASPSRPPLSPFRLWSCFPLIKISLHTERTQSLSPTQRERERADQWEILLESNWPVVQWRLPVSHSEDSCVCFYVHTLLCPHVCCFSGVEPRSLGLVIFSGCTWVQKRGFCYLGYFRKTIKKNCFSIMVFTPHGLTLSTGGLASTSLKTDHSAFFFIVLLMRLFLYIRPGMHIKPGFVPRLWKHL